MLARMCVISLYISFSFLFSVFSIFLLSVLKKQCTALSVYLSHCPACWPAFGLSSASPLFRNARHIKYWKIGHTYTDTHTERQPHKIRQSFNWLRSVDIFMLGLSLVVRGHERRGRCVREEGGS